MNISLFVHVCTYIAFLWVFWKTAPKTAFKFSVLVVYKSLFQWNGKLKCKSHLFKTLLTNQCCARTTNWLGNAFWKGFDESFQMKPLSTIFRSLRGGDHFFSGDNEIFFSAYSERTFQDLYVGLCLNPYHHFSLRYGGPNFGPKNPKIFNFIRNEKF